jgi:hypothetical protein
MLVQFAILVPASEQPEICARRARCPRGADTRGGPGFCGVCRRSHRSRKGWPARSGASPRSLAPPTAAVPPRCSRCRRRVAVKVKLSVLQRVMPFDLPPARSDLLRHPAPREAPSVAACRRAEPLEHSLGRRKAARQLLIWRGGGGNRRSRVGHSRRREGAMTRGISLTPRWKHPLRENRRTGFSSKRIARAAKRNTRCRVVR